MKFDKQTATVELYRGWWTPAAWINRTIDRPRGGLDNEISSTAQDFFIWIVFARAERARFGLRLCSVEGQAEREAERVGKRSQFDQNLPLERHDKGLGAWANVTSISSANWAWSPANPPCVELRQSARAKNRHTPAACHRSRIDRGGHRPVYPSTNGELPQTTGPTAYRDFNLTTSFEQPAKQCTHIIAGGPLNPTLL